MAAVVNFVGNVIKTSVVAVGVVIAAVAGFAYVTKPDEKMLKKDIESEITSNSSNPMELVANLITAKVVTGTSSENVKDYVVVKTADVTFADGIKQSYIGAFQHWIPV